MILPANGSVVIIDDKFKQALPLIQALSKKGISSTYYSGVESDKLPDTPVQNLRLAIVDLQLLSSDNDGHQIATRMVQILKQIISPDNGPYVLLIWSLKQIHFGQALKDEVNKIEHGIVPACIVELDKSRCIQQKTEKDQMNDYINNVVNKLEKTNLVDSDDLESLKDILQEQWIIDDDADFEIKPDAIEVIEKNIGDKLKEAGVFHLFVIWENLVGMAASTATADLSKSIPMDIYWERNMRNVFQRMGIARTGQNIVKPEKLLQESLMTFIQTLTDKVETNIKNKSFPSYITGYDGVLITKKFTDGEYSLIQKENLFEIVKNKVVLLDGTDLEKLRKNIEKHKTPIEKETAKILLNDYYFIPQKINSELHIEISPLSDHIPGNIYEINVDDKEKKKTLLETYFKSFEEQRLDDIIFIEMEISPICDYAQKKWKKSRLISGIIYAADLEIKHPAHFYEVEPLFYLNAKSVRIVFDCHLFKSLDHHIVEKRTVKYRLKRELLLDVIAKVSSHVNRPGISFVS